MNPFQNLLRDVLLFVGLAFVCGSCVTWLVMR